MFYEELIRPLLFRTDPEWIHAAGIRALKNPFLARTLGNMVGTQGHPVEVWNLRFRNVLGLAAGFDKNAEVVPAMYHLGFGFVEVGTVTAHSQPGNPKPRIFRLPEHQALINRLGFPNQGATAVAARLEKLRRTQTFHGFPIGINLGKSKLTDLDQAAEDYLHSFRLLRPHGDFFVINVSSPNTPQLRDLQTPEHLQRILRPLLEANRPEPKPILLKIAPDLTDKALEDILTTVHDLHLHGIIATNTTIDRTGLPQTEQGGLSGAPLFQRSLAMIRHISRVTSGRLPIVGVGGIMERDSLLSMLDAGARLVQTYTGFVYRGPLVVRKLLSNE